MSVGKKVFLLLLCLVGLIIFTVYTYDYNTILNNNDVDNKTRVISMYDKYKNKVLLKYDELKEYIIEKVDINSTSEKEIEEIQKVYNNFEIIKIDNNLILNGIFKDENQANELSKLLEAELDSKKFEKNIEKNTLLLNKLKSILPKFKESFENNSKFIIENQKILIDGQLKQNIDKSMFKEFLEKNDLNVVLNLKTLISKNKIQEKDNTIEENKNKDIVKPSNEKIEIKKEKKELILKDKIQNEINEILSKKKISFQRASIKLVGDSYKAVKEIVALLKKYPNLKVEIGGHTDSKGKASLNKKISQKRANRVMKAFTDLRIDASRLTAVGYGEEFPIVEEKEGLAEANRRVEIKIIGE